MCDKIIFALQESQEKSITYTEFGIINKLDKSKRRPIYAVFDV